MASMVDKSPLQRKRSFGGLINQPENMMRNESFNEKYPLDNNLNGSITKRRRYLSSDTVKENELQHSFMSTPTMEFTHVNNVASGTSYPGYPQKATKRAPTNSAASLQQQAAAMPPRNLR